MFSKLIVWFWLAIAFIVTLSLLVIQEELIGMLTVKLKLSKVLSTLLAFIVG
jgi:hypothetical protein